MSLATLLEVGDGPRHAAEFLTALDRCFLLGFSRLGPDQHQALESLSRIASATPLGKPVEEAVAAMKQNEFLDKHFTSLAIARAAIQGALHDELHGQARAALGRGESKEPSWPAAGEVPANVRSWMESTRHWLMEVAIAGFQQIEHPTLAPFLATLEQIQSEPKLTRLGALLTGFLNELLSSLPVASLPAIPIHRWVDLWTRGMVTSLHVPGSGGAKVGGKLFVLGVDLRHHGFFVSADVYGLLEGATPRIVRSTLSSYKVDVIAGPEVWRCFGATAEPLLQALGKTLALDVKDMILLPTGDLLWDCKASIGKGFNRTELATKYLAPGASATCEFPTVAPVDRHPVQVAELVYLPNLKTDGDPPTIAIGDGKTLPLATQRLSAASEIKPEHLKAATALLGLLRFDSGGWALQPLGVTVGGKQSGEVFTGQSAFDTVKTTPKKGDTLGILKERASRLLRAKK
jgi:hypothetical protein